MARVPTIPCAVCSTLMYGGKSVLPPGQATCQACRRQRNPPKLCSACGMKTTAQGDVCGRCQPRPDRGPRTHGWHRANPASAAVQARRRKYQSPEHRAARVRFRALVEAGLGYCWRCGNLLTPGNWHVGHSDDGTRIMGPEDVGCNLRAAARKGGKVANALALTQNGAGACSHCGATFARRSPTQRFCSPECHIITTSIEREPQPPRPRKFKPPRGVQLEMHECTVCGALTERSSYCGHRCRRERDARYLRNKYRISVGLPPDDRPTKAWVTQNMSIL